MANPSPPGSASPRTRKRPRSPSEAVAEAAAKQHSHPAAAAAAAATVSPAGYIFMCNGKTKPECYRHRVLGVPRGKLDAVSRIRRGAAVFLYDFDAKYLYGPYQADSDGGLHLVPAAFDGRFPAQVKFKIDGDFMPLPESSLRSAINENYFNGRFSPELTATQVEKLRALFQPITLPPESAAPAHDVDNWPLPSHDIDNWPPAPALLAPPANVAHPPTYAHHPTPYVAPPAAHSMPPEAYAPPCPCPYLPPTAPPTTNIYCVTPTGYGCGYGYNVPYSMPAHVSGPTYSTGPDYAPYQNHPYPYGPYQHGNMNHHYQQTTHESATYNAGQDIASSLQLIRHYG